MRGRSVRLLEDQRDGRHRQEGLEHAAQRREQIDHLEPLGRDADPPCLDLGQIEQVVDHFAQLDGRFLDKVHLLLLFVRQGSVHPIEQEPRQAADRPERRAELVAHVGEKPAFQLRRFLQRPGRVIQFGVQATTPLFVSASSALSWRDLLVSLSQQLLPRTPFLGSQTLGASRDCRRFSFVMSVAIQTRSRTTATVTSSRPRVKSRYRHGGNHRGVA